ncbi:MAG: DUF952 domain-containing protein [Ilumatobacteraceae bacterium]
MTTTDAFVHLALPDDWAAAVADGEYRISTRGRTLDEEGFIHCSFPHQAAGVVDRFYADIDELVVLHVDVRRLDAEVRVEPPVAGADDLFPHVYGPIPISAVAATVVWRREAGLGALTRAASPDHP